MAAMPCRERERVVASRQPDGGFISISSQFAAGRMATATTPSISTSQQQQQDLADLSCLEDEAWDKDAPDSPIVAPVRRKETVAVTAPPPPPPTLHRTPGVLRRSRPRPCAMSFDSVSGGVIDEQIEVLVNMLSSQAKFQPRLEGKGVGRGRAGRPMCHEMSPFVAERRRWFVAWKNQMASFLGYSRDTVAVALNYFDRYTCARPCSPTLAQAAAATALHIAAKFEESNPAPLRQLLKFTPVFTPDQLMVMEMSMLKVLNWDLRPVTVFDFVRSFCDLLSTRTVSNSTSMRKRREELKELRTGAEEIADLSACEVGVLRFLPSTVGISALLLSASRPEAVTSHADLLDTCVTAAAGAANQISLERVLDCIRVLGASLARRYPAAGAAADIAAEQVMRYAGFDVEAEDDVARDLAAVDPGAALVSSSDSSAGADIGACGAAAALGSSISPVPPAKKRRCSTPTSVDGIMHIELAAFRAAGGDGVGGSDGSRPRDSRAPAPAPVATAPTSRRLQRRGTNPHRPTPAAAAASVGARSFSFSEDDMVFTAAGQQGVRSEKVGGACGGSASRKSWQPQELSTSVVGCAVGRRKRSADALGHCETGSGFGAPMLRGGVIAAGKAAPSVAAAGTMRRAPDPGL